jgi:hypothetical protein
VEVEGRVQVDGARVFDGRAWGVKRLSVRFGGAKRDSLRLAALGLFKEATEDVGGDGRDHWINGQGCDVVDGSD